MSPCFTLSWQGSARSGVSECSVSQVKRKGGCRDGADCPNCHECFWTKAWENSKHPWLLRAESKDAMQSTYDLKFAGCRILIRMRKSWMQITYWFLLLCGQWLHWWPKNESLHLFCRHLPCSHAALASTWQRRWLARETVVWPSKFAKMGQDMLQCIYHSSSLVLDIAILIQLHHYSFGGCPARHPSRHSHSPRAHVAIRTGRCFRAGDSTWARTVHGHGLYMFVSWLRGGGVVVKHLYWADPTKLLLHQATGVRKRVSWPEKIWNTCGHCLTIRNCSQGTG